MAQLKSRGELTPEELGEQDCEEFSERRAMSLISANVAAPVNGGRDG
jgi:hypothetical protein